MPRSHCADQRGPGAFVVSTVKCGAPSITATSIAIGRSLAALALAIAHVIFRDGLEDRAYLAEMTLGWEKLRERALNEYSPERVAPICRLSVETIERLAKMYATTRPSFIRLNYGLQRHAGGGTAVRAIVTLPLLTGDWNLRGGGAQLSVSGAFGMKGKHIERPEWLRPETRTLNMCRLAEALNDVSDPPVRAMIVCVARMTRLYVSSMCTGMRTARPLSASAREIAWRIHQLAYVLKR